MISCQLTANTCRRSTAVPLFLLSRLTTESIGGDRHRIASIEETHPPRCHRRARPGSVLVFAVAYVAQSLVHNLKNRKAKGSRLATSRLGSHEHITACKSISGKIIRKSRNRQQTSKNHRNRFSLHIRRQQPLHLLNGLSQLWDDAKLLEGCHLNAVVSLRNRLEIDFVSPTTRFDFEFQSMMKLPVGIAKQLEQALSFVSSDIQPQQSQHPSPFQIVNTFRSEEDLSSPLQCLSQSQSRSYFVFCSFYFNYFYHFQFRFRDEKI